MQNILYGALVLAGVMALFMLVHTAYVKQHGGKETKLSCGGCANQDTCEDFREGGGCDGKQVSRYKAVFFDLDGTLLDTAPDLNAAVNAALEMYGLPKRTLAQTKADIGNGTKVLIHKSVPSGTDPEKEALVFDAFREYYTVHSSDLTDVYPGIRGTLTALTGRGLKLAVISNKNNEIAAPLIRKFFADRFSMVFGQRDGVKRKPAPDMFKACLAGLSLQPQEVLYIGDTEVDKTFAGSAGADCLLVTWGYRDRQQLEKAGAVGVIDRPAQILDYI
ncbi:MAG: HAD family hydrolase [Lachnospiraceae bacterium]|jgi:phosphoglycolate phosphatase